MSRLPDLRYAEMTAEQQRVHDEITAGPRGNVAGPFKLCLYSPQRVIEAIRVGAEPTLQDRKSRGVYAVACELHQARALSDDTYAHAEAALGRQGLVDLIAILGYYALISMTLKAFDV